MLIQLNENFGGGGNQTLREVFDLKLKTIQVSPETIRHHKIVMNNYIYPYVAPETRFKDITYLQVLTTLTSAQNSASDDMINRILSVWKQLYKVAIMNDIVQIDQTIKIVKPKSLVPKKPRRKTTSFEEVMAVIDALKKSNNKVLAKQITQAILILFFTGIRPAECFALKKDDFDTDNRTISINKALRIDENRDAYVSTTKTETSIRTVPYPEELDPVIDELKEGYCFIYKNKFLHSRTAAYEIRKYYKDGFSLYQLRHQFATDMVLSGVDLRTIQELMGHSNSSMTVSYMRSNEDEKRKAILKRKNGNKMGTN